MDDAVIVHVPVPADHLHQAGQGFGDALVVVRLEIDAGQPRFGTDRERRREGGDDVADDRPDRGARPTLPGDSFPIELPRVVNAVEFEQRALLIAEVMRRLAIAENVPRENPIRQVAEADDDLRARLQQARRVESGGVVRRDPAGRERGRIDGDFVQTTVECEAPGIVARHVQRRAGDADRPRVGGPVLHAVDVQLGIGPVADKHDVVPGVVADIHGARDPTRRIKDANKGFARADVDFDGRGDGQEFDLRDGGRAVLLDPRFQRPRRAERGNRGGGVPTGIPGAGPDRHEGRGLTAVGQAPDWLSVTVLTYVPLRALPLRSTAIVVPVISSSFQYPLGLSARTSAA
jgi:hypothetical protein